MAIFQYQAITSSGRKMTGTVEASDHGQAEQLLLNMELTVNELSKAAVEKPKTSIGRSEFLLFNQQLASVTRAGVPLEKGLREIAKDISSSKTKKLINEVAADLESGMNIEETIAKRQSFFPKLYGKILKAGIQTGRLTEMLVSLNRHFETQQRTRRIIFESLCYPAVVFVLGMTILTAMFVFVIPTFGQVLQDMSGGKAGLPYLTQMLLNMASNIIPFWGTVAAIGCVFVVVYCVLEKYSEGRRYKEGLLLRIPVFGMLHRYSSLSRFSQAMATLVAAGCNMPDCFRMGAVASGSEKIIQESELLAVQLENGANLVESGHFCKVISGLLLYSVQLGSQRNELEDTLVNLSEMYNSQTYSIQARIEALLLPMLVIFLGIIFGLVVISMFLPMVKMITVLM